MKFTFRDRVITLDNEQDEDGKITQVGMDVEFGTEHIISIVLSPAEARTLAAGLREASKK